MTSASSEADSPTGAFHGSGGQRGEGPYIVLSGTIRLDELIVTSASAQANGCISSMRIAMLIEGIAVGRTPAQLLALESKDLILLVGGLPEGKEYAADLGIGALQEAFAPWSVREGKASTP